jgi:DNA polymerase-3 subunit beta
MKITCSQADLARAVHTAGRAAATSRAQIPILGNLLIQTTENTIRIAATNLEMEIQTRIPAQVEQSGVSTLPARLLTEIVNSLPAEPVEIRSEEGSNRAEIACGRAAFEILGLPPADFPRLSDTEFEPACKVEAALLRAMIRQTVFAASADDTRPFLTGVHVAVENGELRLAATDGGRLAFRAARISGTGPLARIVPGRTMHELVRLLTGPGEIAIGGVEARVMLAAGDLHVASRTIGGPFPDYGQVIPKTFKQQIRVETEKFHEALKRVATTARDSANVVRFETGKSVLQLRSSTPEVGQALEEIEIAAEGEPVKVAFNARYLMDALATIEASEIFLGLTGPETPGALRPADGDDYVYVLAPVRMYE